MNYTLSALSGSNHPPMGTSSRYMLPHEPRSAYCSRDYPFSSNPFHRLKLLQPDRNSALIALLLPSCTGSLRRHNWVAAGDRVPTDEADSERVVVTIPVTTIGSRDRSRLFSRKARVLTYSVSPRGRHTLERHTGGTSALPLLPGLMNRI